jgi:hypothetical protein
MVIEASGIALSTESSNACNPPLTARQKRVDRPQSKNSAPPPSTLQQNCSLEAETFSRGRYPILTTPLE